MAKESNVVNLDYLNSMSGGNKDIIREMIGLFQQQVPEFLSEMKEHHKNGDWHNLGALAHKAKSSIAIMGMELLAEKLKELEVKAKKGEDPDSYQSYIRLFEDQTTTAVSELDQILKTL